VIASHRSYEKDIHSASFCHLIKFTLHVLCSCICSIPAQDGKCDASSGHSVMRHTAASSEHMYLSDAMSVLFQFTLHAGSLNFFMPMLIFKAGINTLITMSLTTHNTLITMSLTTQH
jgi:hypothetical protein